MWLKQQLQRLNMCELRLILLMVQISGVHELRLVLYPIIYIFSNTSKRCYIQKKRTENKPIIHPAARDYEVMWNMASQSLYGEFLKHQPFTAREPHTGYGRQCFNLLGSKVHQRRSRWVFLLLTCEVCPNEPRKTPYYFPLHWLVHRDFSNGI